MPELDYRGTVISPDLEDEIMLESPARDPIVQERLAAETPEDRLRREFELMDDAAYEEAIARAQGTLRKGPEVTPVPTAEIAAYEPYKRKEYGDKWHHWLSRMASAYAGQEDPKIAFEKRQDQLQRMNRQEQLALINNAVRRAQLQRQAAQEQNAQARRQFEREVSADKLGVGAESQKLRRRRGRAKDIYAAESASEARKAREDLKRQALQYKNDPSRKLMAVYESLSAFEEQGMSPETKQALQLRALASDKGESISARRKAQARYNELIKIPTVNNQMQTYDGIVNMRNNLQRQVNKSIAKEKPEGKKGYTIDQAMLEFKPLYGSGLVKAVTDGKNLPRAEVERRLKVLAAELKAMQKKPEKKSESRRRKDPIIETEDVKQGLKLRLF